MLHNSNVICPLWQTHKEQTMFNKHRYIKQRPTLLYKDIIVYVECDIKIVCVSQMLMGWWLENDRFVSSNCGYIGFKASFIVAQIGTFVHGAQQPVTVFQ